MEEVDNFVQNELLVSLSDRLTSRKMFGGVGYYLDGRIFAIVTSDGDLCFKVGDNNRANFEELGGQPFVYKSKKHQKMKDIKMPYWLLPEEIMDDPQKAAQWALKSAENSKSK